MARFLRLYICDYNREIVCDLYDSESKVSGQAFNVHIEATRTSPGELHFSLPPKIVTENGYEDNYRLNYLIADYQILAVKKDRNTGAEKKDYYIISEPKITHNPVTKQVSAVCKHISQMLGFKRLDLEFSDTEGNNVGTAKQFMNIILQGTGWSVGHVHTFVEEDDPTKEKVRTITASSKSGAIKLISAVCEKFDAKPIYDGDLKKVHILPLNPFAKVYENGIPKEIIEGDNGGPDEEGNTWPTTEAVELNYNRNLKSVTRTLNTDNIITKLYVYGSYGDYQTGYCGMETGTHSVLTLNVVSVSSTHEYKFEISNGDWRYFVASDSNGPFYWSGIDLLSRSYVYTINGSTVKPYELTTSPKTPNPKSLQTTIGSPVENNVPYLMNFNYYRRVGLLKDSQLNFLANYQYKVPRLYKTSRQAAHDKADHLEELAKIGESMTGFLKLRATASNANGQVKLTLSSQTSETGVSDHGVIYRSDYEEQERNYFTWYVADEIKPNGDAVNGGSKVLIVHNTNPVTWDFAYITEIYHKVNGIETPIRKEDDPTKPDDYRYGLTPGEQPCSVMLALDYENVYSNSDKYFLFCTNSMAGKLGGFMSSEEAVIQSLNKKLTSETIPHDVIFTDIGTDISGSASMFVDQVNTYGWVYQFDKFAFTEGTLYYIDFDSGIDRWRKVLFADEMPNAASVSNLQYKMFFHNKQKTLWLGVPASNEEPAAWVQMDSETDKSRARLFSYVITECHSREVNYKGWAEEYRYTGTLAKGSYAMRNEYGSYWLFTTDQTATNPKLVYDKKHLYQDSNPEHVVSVLTYPFDTLDFPVGNYLEGALYAAGRISDEEGRQGADEVADGFIRTGYIRSYPDKTYNYTFNVDRNAAVYIYDQNKRFSEKKSLSQSGSFHTPTAPGVPSHPDGTYVGKTYYMRFVFQTDDTPTHANEEYYKTNSVKFNNCDNIVIAGDSEFYTILPAVNASGGFTPYGEYLGLNNLMKKFGEMADQVYLTDLKTLQDAQKDIADENENLVNSLGDMLREGTWQDSSYASGDEERMYKDAMDNFQEISEPEATYEISYIDPYSANEGMEYSITDETNIFNQEVEVTDAVHLIDEDLYENRWAYIDKTSTWYDLPEKSSIQINTKLSTIGQRTFTDVLSHIVDVAKDFKAKQTVYERAETLTPNKQLLADKISGTLNAYRTAISGGSSNWYTNENGNIVFEAADGSSAMMLAGAGLMIANSKDSTGEWQWHTAATGDGIAADAISTGTLSAMRIEAGSITTDKLTPSLGETLVISNNPAVQGVEAQIRIANDSISQEIIRAQEAEEDAENNAKDYADTEVAAAEGRANEYAYAQASAAEGRANSYTNTQINQTAQAINLTVAKKARVWYSSTEPPTSGEGDIAVLGDYWINTSSNNEMKRYDGSTWVNTSYSDPNKYGVVSGINIDADGVTIGGSKRVTLESGSVLNMSSAGPIHLKAQSGMFINSGGGLYIAGPNSNETTIEELTISRWGPNGVFYNHDYPLIYVREVAYHKNDNRDDDDPSKVYQIHLLTTLQSQEIRIEIINVTYLYTTENVEPSANDPNWSRIIPFVNDGIYHLWAKYEIKRTTSTSETTENVIKKIFATDTSGATEDNYLYNVVNYYACTDDWAKINNTFLGYTRTENGITKRNNAVAIDENGIVLSSDGAIRIKSGGTFTVDSGNFSISETGNVSIAGNIDTLTGAIGGWTVDANSLYSGSSSTYVGLDSGSIIEEKAETTGTSSGYYLTGNTITNPFAIWAGRVDPYAAPFSVQRDGAIKFKQAKMGNWTFNNDALERRDTTGHIIISSDYIAGGPPTARMNGAPFSSWTYYNYWKLSVDGTLECKYGKLGEWDLDTYRISNGSGSNYVAIDAGSTVLLYSNYVQYDTKVVNGDTIEYYKNSVLVGTNADTDTLFYYTRSRTKIPTTEYDWEYQDENGNILTYTETTDCCIWTGAEEPRDASFSLKRDGSLKITGAASFNVDSTDFSIDSTNKKFVCGNWTFKPQGIYYYTKDISHSEIGDQPIGMQILGSGASISGNMNSTVIADSHGFRKYDDNPWFHETKLYILNYDKLRNESYGMHISTGKGWSDDASYTNVHGYNVIVKYYGQLVTESSREMKKDIKPLNSIGEIIDGFTPVEFTYNIENNTKKHFGLIHEDTVDILPEICIGNKDAKPEEKAINYIELVPILLKEIQDLRKRVKELENKLG